MSPRPGGEADKLGNRYEIAWAVRHALHCLSDDNHSLTIEELDPEIGKGSEFTYETPGIIQVHQLKRQNGNKNSWTVNALANLNIFEVAAHHVLMDRQFHFVSLLPCMPLRELSERARQSADLGSFRQFLVTEELGREFDALSAEGLLGSPQRAWGTLRGMYFSVQDEHEVIRTNAMLAEVQLTGAPGDLICLAIGEVLLANLGRKLTRRELLAQLDKQGIQPIQTVYRENARDRVSAVTSSWRESVRRELLEPRIERAESALLVDMLREHRTVVCTGTAGSGKSAVLEQCVESLERDGAEVLALRLDRLDRFVSTSELGRRLGLESSPAVALSLAAHGRGAYLVIDQLDAVSFASGRMPENFDVVMDLIQEALSFTSIKVILACRQFDTDNDHRIRSLVRRPSTTTISVNPLPVEVVDAAVSEMGVDSMQLTDSQRVILQTPMHLVLLKAIADQQGAMEFRSTDSLFGAYWERKLQSARRRRSSVRFSDVIWRVANVASDRQTLSIPLEALDYGDLIDDANVLVSEHILVRDGNRYAFFHEAFFDYAFARLWVAQSESLVDFLLRDNQELFRRAQVRSILQHLYEREPESFRVEVADVLKSDQVRFHIKDTVLAVLSGLSSPASEDAQLVLDIDATEAQLGSQCWSRLRRPPWFSRFLAEGLIDSWLDDDDPNLQQRAVDVMIGGIQQHPSEVAELLGARRNAPQYFNWLRRAARFGDAHQSRELFNLLLEAVATGGFDGAEEELWWSVTDLARHQPTWAVELIKARLVDSQESLTLDDRGNVALLKTHSYGASKFVQEAAVAEPLAFAQTVVPYLLRAMAATSYAPHLNTPIYDRHFSFRHDPDSFDDYDLGDSLFAASVAALEALARTRPDDIRPLLRDLTSDPHDSAQFLLYRAMAAGEGSYDDWAVNLLLEGGARLHSGYLSDPSWVARELVRTIAPRIDDQSHLRLEDQLRDLRNAREVGPHAGWSAFCFLSALQERRLTPTGARRLGEYRRKFGTDAPSPPRAMRAGLVASPITAESARKMSDEQWLKAMVRYESDETNRATLTGGAHQLSQILQQETAAEPKRFARLALQMTSELNPAYSEGVLLGLAAAERSDEAAPFVLDAVRHFASLGHIEVDRLLGIALRPYFSVVPLDLVEIILERALNSPDPHNDTATTELSSDNGNRAVRVRERAINTVRGRFAEALGDLLVSDVDGHRTELVRPHLMQLASDPVHFVRSSTAHALAAALRYARPDAVAAFHSLIETDDHVLATDTVQRLMLYIGNVEPEIIDPVIERMLKSRDGDAREAGGALAAFAALEWDRPELMERSLAGDAITRKGAADVCAQRLCQTSRVKLASDALVRLMEDDADEVRQAAACVASELRDQPLRPVAELLRALIESPAFVHATPQVLITLQHAPDKVDDLVLLASQRFISVFGTDASDLRTAAAADARYISDLVVRGLAQSSNPAHRAALLDILDDLLLVGAYGVNEAIMEAERR